MANPVETALTSLATQLTAVATQLTALNLPKGVPAGATPFSACNQAAATTDATPVAIKAATADKRIFICQIDLYNKTTAELPVTIINDEDDVIYAVLEPQSLDDSDTAGKGHFEFDPPLIIPTNKALELTPVGSLGDTYATVTGYVGT
jgi:hypothetical protein